MQEELTTKEAALADTDGEAMANGALWVYSVAFDEFRRALATESKDRAEVLAAMWDHCFTLVQVSPHLPQGQAAVICSLEGDDSLTVRLMEMGFVPGTVVTLLKRAPFGDPLEFRVRGSHVSLGRAEARRVATRAVAEAVRP